MDGPVLSAAQAATAIQVGPPADHALPPAPAPPAPTTHATQLSRPNVPSALIQACPRQAQVALIGLLVLTVLLLGTHTFGLLALSTVSAELKPGEPLRYRLELNDASRSELLQLPGVGPKMADRILDHRAKHGPFLTVTDLTKVSGIGPTTLKRLESWVYVEGAVEPDQVVPAAKKSPSPPAAKTTTSSKIVVWKGPKLNVNTASEADLKRVPLIGKVLSQRIIEERNKKPFTSIEDLRRVKGIGQKRLDNLRACVTVGN
jgi:competence ComEA-like helix-hairpin-helix protein